MKYVVKCSECKKILLEGQGDLNINEDVSPCNDCTSNNYDVDYGG